MDTSTSAHPVPHTIDRLARPRLGLVSRADLLRDGLTERQLEHRLADGSLTRVQQGVYLAAGVRLTLRRELLAACLAAGVEAAASHRAALWLWRLSTEVPPIEITVPHGSCPMPRGVVVHRSLERHHLHRTVCRGVPTTTPARALVDAGAVLRPWQVGAAVELALVRKLVTVAALRHALDDLGGRGRRGAGVLRAYLDDRALADARPESVLEPLMARLCRDHGVGPVLFQPTIVLEGRTLRPDFAIPDVKLVMEIDGLSVHGSREALDHDLERQNLLVRHGYLVLRYTVTHLRHPARVAREVLAVATRRRAELALTPLL